MVELTFVNADIHDITYCVFPYPEKVMTGVIPRCSEDGCEGIIKPGMFAIGFISCSCLSII